MKEFVINGKFLADKLYGITRFGREILCALDSLVSSNDDVTLLIPKNATRVPLLSNIKIQTIGNLSGIPWEQINLGFYVRRHPNVMCVNFCNIAPFFIQPGITVIHDICYKVNPQYYRSLRNKISRLWHCAQYKYLCSHERMIVTVSQFSKSEIGTYYPQAIGKISVVPNAWQHITQYAENPTWETAYPFLKRHKFFFSLSTLGINKNMKWIVNAANRNPASCFAIAGKKYEKLGFEIPKNVHLLGYVSNEDVCSLIKNCKAFIFPSFYEGFGLPPLEALALGADVIASNTASMPEVLEKSVHYIDPYSDDVDIENLISQKVESPDTVLLKYDWKKSAVSLYNIMKEF